MEFFMGQIVPIAFSYAPKYTAFCSGQTLPINQNQALFSLLGTTYGGNGVQTFGLPNTMGRTLFGTNSSGGYPLGAIGGEDAHTLTQSETPTHTHALSAQTGGTASTTAVGSLPGTSSVAVYGPASNLMPLAAGPLALAGGGQPHTNMQPSTAINFAIVLNGIFPSRP